MKRFFIPLVALAIGWSTADSKAAIVMTDPALCAAIFEQTGLLKKEQEKRSKNHLTIQGCQAAMTVALEEIHRVEETVLEYMANASGVLQNMYQLKRIGELVVLEIPENLVKLGKDIPHNLKGTAITLFVNKTVTETTADITALSDIIERLVKSHYSFKDSKDDKNINLLSAAERFSILNSIYHRLNNINRRLWLTNYFIKTFGWMELWKGIDREGYCNYIYSRVLAKQLINQWNKLKD